VAGESGAPRVWGNIKNIACCTPVALESGSAQHPHVASRPASGSYGAGDVLQTLSGPRVVTLEHLAGDTKGDLVSTFTMSWSDDTTGIILSPVALVETLATLVSLPWVSLVRYGGCVTLHSNLRGVLTPIPREAARNCLHDVILSQRNVY
jgi:hypothetical protein